MSAPQKRKIDDRGDEHDGEDLDKRRRLQPNFGDLDIATADVAHVGHQPLEAAKVPGAASTLGFGVVQAVPAVDSPKDNLIAVDQAHTLVGTGMQVATVALSDGVAVSGAADSMSVPEAATAPPDASLSSGALSPGTLPPGSLPHSALPAAGISPNDFAAAAISAAAISAAAISAATLPAAAMPSGALATETSHTLMGVTGVGVSAPQLSSFDAAAHAVGDAQIASAAAAAAAVADATAVVGSGLLTSSNGIASIAVESNAPQAFTPHADGRSRPFLCGICGKGFLRTGDKNRHIKTVHEKLRKAQCHICGGTVRLFRVLAWIRISLNHCCRTADDGDVFGRLFCCLALLTEFFFVAFLDYFVCLLFSLATREILGGTSHGSMRKASFESVRFVVLHFNPMPHSMRTERFMRIEQKVGIHFLAHTVESRLSLMSNALHTKARLTQL